MNQKIQNPLINMIKLINLFRRIENNSNNDDLYINQSNETPIFKSKNITDTPQSISQNNGLFFFFFLICFFNYIYYDTSFECA